MKIIESSPEKLVIVHFPKLLCGIVASSVLATVASGAVQISHGGVDPKVIMGHGAIALLLLVPLLLVTKTTFAFEKGTRQLAWSQLGLLIRQQGLVPFNAISEVVIQPSLPPKSARLAYRLALTTPEGPIFLPKNHLSGGLAICRTIREAIRDLIGLPPKTREELDTEDLRVVLRRNLKSMAEMMVVDQRRCHFQEAKIIVKDLAATMPPA